jgi:hypothetical protein
MPTPLRCLQQIRVIWNVSACTTKFSAQLVTFQGEKVPRSVHGFRNDSCIWPYYTTMQAAGWTYPQFQTCEYSLNMSWQLWWCGLRQTEWLKRNIRNNVLCWAWRLVHIVNSEHVTDSFILFLVWTGPDKW